MIKRQTKPKKNEHYVNNAEFAKAIVDFKQNEKSDAMIPDYIAKCFLKIAQGLASRPNFSGYSYKEDMVMDGVENCVKAIRNYSVDAKTRSGLPNAFGYFNQIIFFAFLRRIAKEKKQQDIKERLIENTDMSQFMVESDETDSQSMVERIRQRREG